MRRFPIVLMLIAGAIAPAIGVSGAAGSEVGTGPRHPRPVTGIGIQLVDVPTATIDDPRARTYIIDRLAPGTTIERRIQVTNGTRSTAHVSVYAAAADIKRGDFIGAAGQTRNAVSTWTTVTPASLVLAPRHKAFAHVTIQVPANAAPGETYGVVWAQVTTAPTTPGGLTQVSRVGVRLYLSIGPGGAPASDFEIVSLTAARDSSDAPMVSASIRNTGGRALDLTGELRLTDGPGGLSAGPFPITLGTTLGIGQTEPVSVSLNEQLPDGPWLATIAVKSGLTKRSAHATLTFPAGPGVGAPVAAESGGIPPWLVAAGVALALLLLAVLGWFLARRRRGHPNPSEDVRDRVSVDA